MLKKITRFAAISVASFFLIAFGLLISQPIRTLDAPETLDFAGRYKGASAPLTSWAASDGTNLYFREYGTGDDTLVIFLHGSSWHGVGYDDFAQRIASAPGTRVLVPDLRGHGPNADRLGDLDYIGQLQDDIAELAAAHLKKDTTFILSGFSSGGGLALKYAGSAIQNGQAVPDGVALLSPYLHHTSPTVRENSGGWAYPLVRRIIGLSMLNSVGIRMLNGTQVIQFNMPQEFIEKGAAASYTYRMQMALSPDDWQTDIRNLPPFDVIVGEDDESFHSEKFESVMSDHSSRGRYHIIPNAKHLSVLRTERAAALVRDHIARINTH